MHTTSRCQKDRAAVRAEIEVLRRERLAYEQEGMETHQALARSEAHCRALEARVTVLETEVCYSFMGYSHQEAVSYDFKQSLEQVCTSESELDELDEPWDV
ncbi:hypothetical protein Tco_1115392 [Tanacetum coccineum]